MICDTECLKGSFTCALEKDGIWVGKMFLMTTRLVFHGKMFNKQAQIVVEYKDMISVEKRNSAGIFPNALKICTSSRRHHFTSIIKRETCYSLIMMYWNASPESKFSKPKSSSTDMLARTEPTLKKPSFMIFDRRISKNQSMDSGELLATVDKGKAPDITNSITITNTTSSTNELQASSNSKLSEKSEKSDLKNEGKAFSEQNLLSERAHLIQDIIDPPRRVSINTILQSPKEKEKKESRSRKKSVSIKDDEIDSSIGGFSPNKFSQVNRVQSNKQGKDDSSPKSKKRDAVRTSFQWPANRKVPLSNLVTNDDYLSRSNPDFEEASNSNNNSQFLNEDAYDTILEKDIDISFDEACDCLFGTSDGYQYAVNKSGYGKLVFGEWKNNFEYRDVSFVSEHLKWFEKQRSFQKSSLYFKLILDAELLNVLLPHQLKCTAKCIALLMSTL